MKTVNWKVYGEALDALQAQFSAEDGIQIHNCNFARQGTPVNMGVQWESFGTKPPEDAILFATRLAQAALAAVTFEYNGYVVDYAGVISDAWIPCGTGTCSGGRPRSTPRAARAASMAGGSRSSGSLNCLPVRSGTGRKQPITTGGGAHCRPRRRRWTSWINCWVTSK